MNVYNYILLVVQKRGSRLEEAGMEEVLGVHRGRGAGASGLVPRHHALEFLALGAAGAAVGTVLRLRGAGGRRGDGSRGAAADEASGLGEEVSDLGQAEAGIPVQQSALLALLGDARFVVEGIESGVAHDVAVLDSDVLRGADGGGLGARNQGGDGGDDFGHDVKKIEELSTKDSVETVGA